MYKASKYDPGDVILSIGAFRAATLEQWQDHTQCLIVDYDATPESCAAKRALEARNSQTPGKLECHAEAVTDKTGEATLYRYRGGPQGDTIITAWQEHVQAEEYFVGQVKVKTVSMAEVLARFERVREVHLNCEGAEIPILLNTPLAFLGRCQYLACEFHRFSSFLQITEGDVRRCILRLESLFKTKCVEDYHPFYEFVRRQA